MLRAATRRAQPSTARAPALVALAVALSVLGGCGGNSSTTSFDNLKPPKPKRALTAPGASLSIETPRPGSSQPRTFTVRVRVAGFHLARGQTVPRRGYGHLRFSLDRGRYDQPQYAGPNGRLALQLGVNGYYSPSYAPLITYRAIPRGAHTLAVELVNNDDSPTGMRARVRFEVR